MKELGTYRRMKWVYRETLKRDVRYYLLANYLYDKYDTPEKRESPDYVPGIEWEPFCLYVIPSGFSDTYHVIEETGEDEYGARYFTMNRKEILDRFKVDVLDESDSH